MAAMSQVWPVDALQQALAGSGLPQSHGSGRASTRSPRS